MDAKEIRVKLLEEISKIPGEQAEELEEKLESMSDEEVFKLVSSQNDNCLFCNISSGKIETFRVYESENIIAILDINPVTKGHILVMPKKHFTFIFQLPNELTYEIFYFVKMLSSVLMKVTGSQGITITIMQGIEQHVPHFAVNVIPRYKEDKLSFNQKRQKASKDELENLRNLISQEMSKFVGSQMSAKEEQQKEIKQEKNEETTSDKKTEVKRDSRRMRVP